MTNDEKQMKLDLLVDDELPQEQRAAVLRGLGAEEWRALSIRFLQRQVERKGVKQLIAGSSVYPEDAVIKTYPFSKSGGSGPLGLRNIAAGLLIAAASVAITAGVLSRWGAEHSQLAGATQFQPVSLPGSMLGGAVSDAPVEVPVLASTHGVSGELFLPAESENGNGTKRTLVIVPQGDDNAVVVPVNQRAGVTVH